MVHLGRVHEYLSTPHDDGIAVHITKILNLGGTYPTRGYIPYICTLYMFSLSEVWEYNNDFNHGHCSHQSLSWDIRQHLLEIPAGSLLGGVRTLQRKSENVVMQCLIIADRND